MYSDESTTIQIHSEIWLTAIYCHINKKWARRMDQLRQSRCVIFCFFFCDVHSCQQPHFLFLFLFYFLFIRTSRILLSKPRRYDVELFICLELAAFRFLFFFRFVSLSCFPTKKNNFKCNYATAVRRELIFLHWKSCIIRRYLTHEMHARKCACCLIW